MAEELGATAYLLQWLRRSQGEPLSLTTAYLPQPTGHRLRQRNRSGKSVMAMLRRLGQPTTAVRYSVGAIPADADAARALDVPLGAPLLRVRSVLTDEAGSPRAVLESLCRSDRLQFKMLEPKPG